MKPNSQHLDPLDHRILEELQTDSRLSMRELGRRGADCLDDTVEAIMTANPVGCTKDDESDQVFQKMTDGRFRHLPVLEDGRMIGLISIGDVVKCRLSELAMEKDALEGMIMGH